MTEKKSKPRKELGPFLLDGAFIKPEALKAAEEEAQRTGKKLAEVLLNQNLITPETLAMVMSLQHSAPLIDLKGYKIQLDALALIPEEIAREYNALALSVNGDVLTVAMDDPGNIELADILSAMSRKRIKLVVPLHGGIREAIKKYYPEK